MLFLFIFITGVLYIFGENQITKFFLIIKNKLAFGIGLYLKALIILSVLTGALDICWFNNSFFLLQKLNIESSNIPKIENIWTEFHGVLFDLFFLMSILKYFELKEEVKKKTQENVEDLNNKFEILKVQKTKEASLEIILILKKLSMNGIHNFDLDYCKIFGNYDYPIKDVVFNHALLRNCEFKDTNFNNCEFDDCKFSFLQFSDSYLNAITIKNISYFYDVSFIKVKLNGVKFNNCDIGFIDIFQCSVDDLGFNNCTILIDSKIKIDYCSINNFNTKNCIIKGGIDFRNCIITYINFQNQIELENSTFIDCFVYEQANQEYSQIKYKFGLHHWDYISNKYKFEVIENPTNSETLMSVLYTSTTIYDEVKIVNLTFYKMVTI